MQRKEATITKWEKTLDDIYNNIVVLLFFDSDLPLDQRKRFEEVVHQIEPELFENVYLPFTDRNFEPFFDWIEVLKENREKIAMSIFDKQDKTMVVSQKRKRTKRYTLSQTARVLDVPRQTMYYWIHKKWINPKRDFKNYPVFTVTDIENLLKWRDEIRIEKIKRKRTVRLYDTVKLP